jgi:phosphatidylinositol-3-phosphatase
VKRGGVLIALGTAALVAVAGGALVAARQHRGGDTTPPAAASSPAAGSPAASASATPPGLAHIFVIVDENTSYSQIIGNPAAPYINSLAKHFGLATDYQALFHPSLPNYIALTSGSNHGITDDRSPPSAGNEIAVPNIADRIEASGRTWKAYAESLPSAGYAFDAGQYATKHEPFVYYKDIVGSAPRARAHVVPFTQLAADLQSAASTPSFAFITPNLCNDMHDCPIATGDRWLARTVPMILGSKAFTTTRSLLVITWDEGTIFDNHVATILAGNAVKTGFRSAQPYDHYSLLRTIEAAWNLAPLTANDAGAATMSAFLN